MPDLVSVRSVVFDCLDPAALATFYAELLEGRPDISDPEWCEVIAPPPTLKLAFRRVHPYSRPRWPDGSPQQLHLDLTVVDLFAASRRARSLGAVVLSDPVHEPNCTYVVHADPAGHPFCLCQET